MMRKTNVTDKHTVGHVITNLNEEDTTHKGALTVVLYTKQLPLITEGDLKRCFEETYI